MDVTAAESTGVSETDVSNKNVQNNWINPMLLSPVITCISQFLNLEDLKNCRLATREWALNSKLRMRALSKIVLSNKVYLVHQSSITSEDEDNAKREGDEELHFTTSKFFEDFPDALNIPFTAFKFKTAGIWKVNELRDFFERQQENLRELELNCVRLLDEENYLIEKFNITPWVEYSSMTKPKTKYNTKLAVNCHPRISLSVSLSALARIKDISLTEVNAIVDNRVLGEHLNPIKLKLDNVEFSLGHIVYDDFWINHIIDFSKSKHVHLIGGKSKITLDLDLGRNGRSVNLDSLTLHNVTVFNWSNSKWKVKKLNMVLVPIMVRCRMPITELEFSMADIQLRFLPHSIEMLTLHNIGARLDNTRVFYHQSQPPILQNLRYLYLNIVSDDNCHIISYFKNCPQLVDLCLDGEHHHQMVMKFEFDHIPKSIKRLKVTRMQIIWVKEAIAVDNGLLVLDRLILYDYSCKDLKNILIPNIKVKEIIMDNSRDDRECDFHKDFIAILQHLVTYSDNNVQRLFAGPFNWAGKSELENFVDCKAKYYVFENQRGVAIEENEFQKLKKII